MNDTESLFPSAGTFRLKRPLVSVEVPDDVPSTMTDTPWSGFCVVASTTLPVILLCAYEANEINAKAPEIIAL